MSGETLLNSMPRRLRSSRRYGELEARINLGWSLGEAGYISLKPLLRGIACYQIDLKFSEAGLFLMGWRPNH
jgi:hypothetical protein